MDALLGLTAGIVIVYGIGAMIVDLIEQEKKISRKNDLKRMDAEITRRINARYSRK